MGPTSLTGNCLSAVDPCTSGDGPPAEVHASQKVVTALIVAGPALALGTALWWLWGGVVNLSDVVMASVFYLVTGFGITIGFHRLFTHRGFAPHRALKITLAVLGSMAVEGSVTSWVATHRRHHMFSDLAGDPHSPHRYGDRGLALIRGLAFSHVGWLFVSDASSTERYAPDMLRDRDLVRIGRLFPVLALASLAIPFGIGYAVSGSWVRALMALVWAGLVRMALLHHVTWSVNSLCHTFGRRSDVTTDRSTNLWPLAVLSLGDAWHNVHHAHPSWARHGAHRGMIDPSAWLIVRFERWGWVTRVRWPQPGVDGPSAFA
ncbi:MAG TPA: acyl-CoA desaturase [Acidimicrobiales bacterium]|nr:acyl-CoA desaturase [Acidimicrobiales bacterium]